MAGNLLLTAVLIFLLILGCAKKEISQSSVIIGKDTLMESSIKEMKVGAEEPDIQRALLFLAGAFLSNEKIDDESLINDFKERLELESNEEWDEKSAEALYKTAVYLKKRYAKDGGEAIARKFKSAVSGDLSISLPDKSFDIPSIKEDQELSKNDLEILMVKLAGFDNNTVKVVSEFAFMVTEENDSKDSNVDDMVAGLVFDSASAKRENAVKKGSTSVKKIVDNSKTLIKYRSLESIKDSISKHSINIQSIYKKQLKIDEEISGVIFVKFSINEAGNVVGVKVSRSEIKNKDLHENLLSYVKNIKFKSIPQGKGIMHFDFPFEFRSE